MKLQSIKTTLNLIGATVKEARDCAAVARKEIFQEMNGLREEISTAEIRLMGDDEEALNKKEKALLLQQDELEFGVRGMEGMVGMGEKILEKGTEIEIAMSRKPIITRAETLMKMEVDKEPVEDGKIGFEKNGYFKEIKEKLKLVGEVVVEGGAVAEHSMIILGGREVEKGKGKENRINLGDKFEFQLEGRDSKGDKGAKGTFQVEIKGPVPVEVGFFYLLSFR